MPRLALKTLQLSVGQGGLALPNFQQYYWAAVLVKVRCWFSQPRDNPAVTLEAVLLGSYATLSNLVYRGVKTHPELTTLMRTTIMVWHRARVVYRSPDAFSSSHCCGAILTSLACGVCLTVGCIHFQNLRQHITSLTGCSLGIYR